VHALVEDVEARFGPIDVLVNNAGALVGRYAIDAITETIWDDVMETNLKSAVLCSRAVLPSMRARRTGAIVNVGSIAAHTGGGMGAAAYATAKAGLVGFTKALAKEVAADNVRVNAVSPGVIDTEMQRRFSPPGRLEHIQEQIPIGRLGRAAECAHVIAFLASEAASYIVGETIEVNGGLLMR
jgi:3-oxoacyl-[acyl-carrier protein] reductase